MAKNITAPIKPRRAGAKPGGALRKFDEHHCPRHSLYTAGLRLSSSIFKFFAATPRASLPPAKYFEKIQKIYLQAVPYVVV
jgi:hypothetical protein